MQRAPQNIIIRTKLQINICSFRLNINTTLNYRQRTYINYLRDICRKNSKFAEKF